MATIQLGPWPHGKDNFHAPGHKVFQVPGQGDPPARLVAATDVDLDDEGWVQSRPGVTAVLAPTAALRGFSALGMLLIQDGDEIQLVDLTTEPVTATALVSGIEATDPVRFHEFDGQVFWTTTTYAGRITASGLPKNWGMLVPPTPTLTTSAGGTMPAGTYQVTATYVDADGIESGAPKAAAITVDGTKDISATFTVNDANAVSVRFYMSGPDGQGLYWTKTVAVANLPTVLSEHNESLFTLATQHMRGPIPGSGLFSYKGMIFTYRGRWVFPSNGLSPHLFNPAQEVLYVPAPIRAAAGLAAGMWLATERGLFWLQGDSLKNLTATRKDYEYYARGSLVVSGGKIPALQTPDPVALFANSNGLVACTSSGQAMQLTQDRYVLGDVTEKHASISYVERGQLRDFMISLSATTPEAEDYEDPSGSYSLVGEDAWTPMLARLVALEANQLPSGALAGDVLTWDGNEWAAVTPAP